LLLLQLHLLLCCIVCALCIIYVHPSCMACFDNSCVA
jgi:hypothetical protein